MAALLILAGIGVFCWLLYTAAIYALPFFVGLSIFFHAEQSGAGALRAVVLGFGIGVLALIVGQTVFMLARSPFLRVAIALVFATPAAIAGYFTTSALFSLTSASDGWRHAFAIPGAVAVGAIAWQRLAAMAPPADADLQPRPGRRREQGGRHLRWTHAADLFGARSEPERVVPTSTVTERDRRPSLERLAQ
jgi:MFS family permease